MDSPQTDWNHDYNALLDSLASSPNPVELVCTDPIYAEAMLACYQADALLHLLDRLDLNNPRFEVVVGHTLFLSSKYREAAEHLLPLAEKSDYALRILAHLGMSLYGYKRMPEYWKRIDAVIPGPEVLPITEASGTVFWYNWSVRREHDNVCLLEAIWDRESAPCSVHEDLMQIIGICGHELFQDDDVIGLANAADEQYPHSQIVKDMFFRSAISLNYRVTISIEEVHEITRYIGPIILALRRLPNYYGQSISSLYSRSYYARTDLFELLTPKKSDFDLLKSFLPDMTRNSRLPKHVLANCVKRSSRRSKREMKP